jgi:hypothetical protein
VEMVRLNVYSGLSILENSVLKHRLLEGVQRNLMTCNATS